MIEGSPLRSGLTTVVLEDPRENPLRLGEKDWEVTSHREPFRLS